MSEIILICGCPGSGKSTIAKVYQDQGYIHINRDKLGLKKKMVDLFPIMIEAIDKKQNIILDNVFTNEASRKPFIELASSKNLKINCIYLNTSIEEAQINVLLRMHKRYNKFFMNADEMKSVKDSNVFPPLVLFKYRKDFTVPSIKEGFASVNILDFKRIWTDDYKNKALILDYDQNIRETKNEFGYPIEKNEIKILPGRYKKIKEYKDKGYILCGVSNQSGIHKGRLTKEKAIELFEHTNKMLGLDIDYLFCPHNAAPPSCYCRKPGLGNFVKLVTKYYLDVKQCLFIGDQKTDETASKRIGIPFQYTDDFFN